MKSYLVGGTVRDRLLGLPDADRDHVVVGATPEGMQALGYRPVGKDFPVFLHPQTQEEYALARTERKSGRGYKGFTVYCAPEVTLEDDLQRRDLTINAIALDEASGELIDPYHGQRDLHARVLRHVSPAFAEDPVRLLRVARFAARFPDFSVAPETLALMRSLVQAGEVEVLVPERVWQELARGLMADRPSRMLQVLDACEALTRLVPGLNRQPAVLAALDRSAAAHLALPERFTVWMQDAQDLALTLRSLRAPDSCKQTAIAFQRWVSLLGKPFTPPTILDGLEAADAFRKPERFESLLRIAAVQNVADVVIQAWRTAFMRAREVDAGAVARQAPTPAAIRSCVRQAREEAVGDEKVRPSQDGKA